jgi:site-specific DNA-methyltransferase (adenine-specific)
MHTLYHGDCLDILPTLEPQSVDAVICDPPYGTTACKWDSVIPFAPMWEGIKRVLKPRGVVVLFGSQPFTSALVMSNPGWFKYEWVWEKNRPTNFAHAKNKPMKAHENVLIFSGGTTIHKGQSANRMTYNPVGLTEINEAVSYTCNTDVFFAKRPSHGAFLRTHTGYPRTILRFDTDLNDTHPTQKPLALLEYLIQTYTDPGDVVLDFAMGSGTTGHACANLGRGFVGIEQDAAYFAIAQARIDAAAATRQLPLEEAA